ncbi:MAG: pseudouridine-5'-phosphate glycosidase [Phycisphaeraceae bacterium]|nr:MAG: pseudouridine-5'-phosphate glycosidase [Phycisphaeraceae bacterium]
MDMLDRSTPQSVALETTLPALGLPAGEGLPFSRELNGIIRSEGAEPSVIGVLRGRPIVGMTDDELAALLDSRTVEKANTANLGLLIHRGADAATTVSATMELAAAVGVRVFATGGIGGVHKDYGRHLDISADLAALARFPVAVVASGTKSLLDVVSTREALESLGVPVVGFRCDRFPAFYLRESDATLDARFENEADLAVFIADELDRTGRGVLVCNPIPEADEVTRADWDRWLAEAERRCAGIGGRDITPCVLGALHEVSGGATLLANLALVRSNARLGARLAARLGGA